MILLNESTKEYNLIIKLYEIALKQVVTNLNDIKNNYNKKYSNEIIDKINFRIKTKESIINKMKKKKYKLNFRNLINHINDIAGVRVICPLKDSVYLIVKAIENIPNIRILESKDYIKQNKKSGYSGYHLIVETPIRIQQNKELWIKVEIQIRTMAMDFWATNEHKLKYKSGNKLSRIDSKKLTLYAKILKIIDNGMMKIYQKHNPLIPY